MDVCQVSALCLSRNPLRWVAVLILFMVTACLLGFGFLPILITSSVLVLSTCFFMISKHKPVQVEEPVKELLRTDQEVLPQNEEVLSNKQEPESETVTQKYIQEEAKGNQIHDSVRSSDSLSESESVDHSSTSEDSEVDWPFQDNMAQSPEFSDGSISDEESLIEIALPSGHYVDLKEEEEEEEEEAKLNLQQKLPDFASESIFNKHSLMEFLAEINEMNEEENLIEIDISMGSIKCSRFEIEA